MSLHTYIHITLHTYIPLRPCTVNNIPLPVTWRSFLSCFEQRDQIVCVNVETRSDDQSLYLAADYFSSNIKGHCQSTANASRTRQGGAIEEKQSVEKSRTIRMPVPVPVSSDPDQWISHVRSRAPSHPERDSSSCCILILYRSVNVNTYRNGR